MHLRGKFLIDEFKEKHPSSRKSLERWEKLIEHSDFQSPQDVKSLFGVNVDFVGNQTVFDVGGNKVRVVTALIFNLKIVLVTHVLTHSEYDKKKWRE